MRFRIQRSARAAGVALALFSAAALASGCGGRSAPPAGPPDATYAVRGEIRQLPRPEGNELMIRHEAVPDLKDSKGKVVGMASMTMPFALGADVDRSRLAVGDRISFTLEVRWDAANPVTATRVAPLPPGTRLDFDPPADQPAESQPAEAEPVEPPPSGGAAGDTPR